MKEISNKKRKKKGFTLIELIIVIAIIAIIGAIALPNFTKIRTESKVKAEKQSVQNITRITETLLIDQKLLPGDVVNIAFTGTNGAAVATKTAATTSGSATDTELTEYFKGVNKPQEDGKTGYKISIDSTSKEVSVTTTPATTTP
ncbi:prepilin-type N-terminal cleavage/methylation domain-containing protein [Clostridium sp. UBA4548]|uniref:prepilin-type N-terminal cleavage/methylation domain-containing protein n=1 Tax=Clostridium sp. UBA4548 TaxID=1946361 RepID=UPI0025B8D301|nr:prepilin-type N-terminal cleavage/methylation domain-containing protein [Clostridium sp. UBA4548]